MSTAFLVDEDMPRSTTRVLRTAGFQVEDVPDAVNRELLGALISLAGEDLRGVVVIVEVGRVRIRRS